MAELRIDWMQLALNLRQRGSLRKLSAELGQHIDYLGQLARGEIKEPRFSVGLKLLDVHLDQCGAEVHRRILLK